MSMGRPPQLKYDFTWKTTATAFSFIMTIYFNIIYIEMSQPLVLKNKTNYSFATNVNPTKCLPIGTVKIQLVLNNMTIVNYLDVIPSSFLFLNPYIFCCWVMVILNSWRMDIFDIIDNRILKITKLVDTNYSKLIKLN